MGKLPQFDTPQYFSPKKRQHTFSFRRHKQLRR
jgi:hypothetical protein